MRLRLHHRIVIPFAAVAIVATLAIAVVALRVTSTTVESHIREDVISATNVVSRNGVALSPGILMAVKQVAGADVVTYGPDGLLVTTLTGDDRDALVARVIQGGREHRIGDQPLVVELPGEPSVFAAYRQVVGEADTYVALLHENTEVERANEMLTRTIVGTAVFSLVAMLVVSQFVARRVTAPITRLAAFAQDVSTSEPRGRAEAGTDEVGRLGHAFNDMLERLDQAQSALVKAEKLSLAGLLAARVAHDVRNPLSAMKMQAQMLDAQLAPGSEGQEMTQAMLHDISQVEFVVKGLLELGRPSELRRVPCRLNDVVEGVIRQITPQCRHRHITLCQHLAPMLPEMRLDTGRLTQALLNVVVNATEALREGGTLTVSSRLASDGRHAIVEVEDDGVGLQPEAVGKLFDPFVTTKPGGVGLGLMNARAAVESHGGTIRLEPRQPAGTRVCITLPVG